MSNILLRIENEGNTCYFNSVFQAFFAFDELNLIIVNELREEDLEDIENTFLFAYKKAFEKILLFHKHNDMNEIHISLEKLHEIFLKEFGNSFKKHRQEDAGECLLNVINHFISAVNSISDFVAERIKKHFSIEQITKVKCLKCRNKNINTQEELFLNLYISKNNKEIGSVGDLIKNLTTTEKIKNYDCEICEKSTSAIINTFFKHSPKYLIVNINRFKNNFFKSNGGIIFDKYIEIPFLEDNNVIIISKYKLIAMISHFGNPNSGHYWITKRINKKWYRISDENVFENNIDFGSKDVCIVIYKKINL